MGLQWVGKESLRLPSKSFIGVHFQWGSKFNLLLEQKFQIWSKVQPKISKIASPSMKICTGIPTLASSRQNSIFLSYDWSPVAKNEDVFDKFY